MKRCSKFAIMAMTAAIFSFGSAYSQDTSPPAESPTASETPAKPTPTPNPAHLTAVFEPFPGGVEPSTVTKDQLGSNLVVTGTIAKFEPSSGDRVPHRITLFEEGDHAFEVVYWPDAAARVHSEAGDMPFVGQKISVKGKLGEYRERLQIRVSNPKAIRLQGFNGSSAPPAVAAPATTSAGSADVLTVTQALALPGSSATLIVEGDVASFKASWGDRAPNLLKIADDENEIEIVFFPSDKITTPEELLKPGAKIQVSARRSDYNGKTQLKLTPGGEIRPAGTAVAASASTATISPDQVVNSGDLDTMHIGKTVTVAGTVEGVVPASDGRYAIVRDRDGIVFVFLAPEMEGADMTTKLTNGNRLRIKGDVEFSELRSQLVVVPKAEDALTVSKSGE